MMLKSITESSFINSHQPLQSKCHLCQAICSFLMISSRSQTTQPHLPIVMLAHLLSNLPLLEAKGAASIALRINQTDVAHFVKGN